MFQSPLDSSADLAQWSLLNAGGMVATTFVAVWLGSAWPVVIVGSGLLGGLILTGWTTRKPFGAANGTTLLRVALLSGLPPAAAMGPVFFVPVGVVFLLADILDGWLARRHDMTSTFGALFDKEVDALFLLVLCTLAAFEERLPVWIVGAGLLRYGFVVVRFLMPPRTKEHRFAFARYAYGSMVGGLLISFLPYPNLYRPVVFLATGMLLVSFGWSTMHVFASGSSSEDP